MDPPSSEQVGAALFGTARGRRRKIVQSSHSGRSVVDYEDPEELREALEARLESVGCACAAPPPDKSDWKLPVPDPDAEPESVLNEMQRLLLLKSYLILDASAEEAFDALTRQACEIYNVPTSLISLVDLGRQFLFAQTGAGDRDSPRTSAFCSHTILSKRGICVVPDTLKDPRFHKNSLVTGGPRLRFYAGAPLISPEGYKLGTFCVEGPEPRPEGLSPTEQELLKEFAAKTMHLMVERRKNMQRAYRASNLPENEHLRRHAAVTTNLGSLVLKFCMTESVLAMFLFQESVQTLMHLEDGSQAALSTINKDRRDSMTRLFETMNAIESREQGDEVIREVHQLYPDAAVPPHAHSIGAGNSIPGLFSTASKLKMQLAETSQPGLFFNEPFEVHMEPSTHPKDPLSKLDDRSFTIPLEQCSKATLFNMGLIHYHWGAADSAMQFFDLAASLSQIDDATNFDPVVLGCLNNMAQIHLQYGRPGDAMEMLNDALTRGNAALTTIYASGSDDVSLSSQEAEVPYEKARQDQDIRRTKRLRRKLCRTLLNIGHVHFFKCDYDAALATCNDALVLLHTDMDEVEVVAIWFNISLVRYHRGEKLEALEKLEDFIDSAKKFLPSGQHDQYAEAYHRKGKILFEMGKLHEAMSPSNEALRIRQILFGGQDHPDVADTLCLIGRVLQEREEYDFALNALEQGLAVQRRVHAAIEASQQGETQRVSFDVAQTLLEIGRALHAQRRIDEALSAYLEVVVLTRTLFGEKHPFVARIENIIGNLYLESGNVDESVKHFQSAMKIHVEQGLPVDMAVVQDPLLKVSGIKPPSAAQGA
jgi:tetratricopeptide (TPR) repeat protein